MVGTPKLPLPDHLPARLAAWWDGREFVPGESGDVAANENKPPQDPRLQVMELVWGEGYFSPNGPGLSTALAELTDPLSDSATIGFLTPDPGRVLLVAGEQIDRCILVDWRDPCRARLQAQFGEADVRKGDVDRPGFAEESLDGIVSLEGFLFSDHKLGLMTRAFKALKPGGRLVVADYARLEADASFAPAFANAFAEPQIAKDGELSELATMAGLEAVEACADMTEAMVTAIKSGFTRLDARVASAIVDAPADERTRLVKELAWELQAWKWRQRALEGGLLAYQFMVFQRPGAE